MYEPPIRINHPSIAFNLKWAWICYDLMCSVELTENDEPSGNAINRLRRDSTFIGLMLGIGLSAFGPVVDVEFTVIAFVVWLAMATAPSRYRLSLTAALVVVPNTSSAIIKTSIVDAEMLFAFEARSAIDCIHIWKCIWCAMDDGNRNSSFRFSVNRLQNTNWIGFKWSKRFTETNLFSTKVRPSYFLYQQRESQ